MVVQEFVWVNNLLLTEASYVISRLAQLFPVLESRDEQYPPNKCIHLTMNHDEGVFVSMN